MATSHVQPLLFLLVSLFFSPALCGTSFQTCYSITGIEFPVKVNSVDISPNPLKRSGNGEITITAITNKEISDGVTVDLLLKIRKFVIFSKTYSLCDITACPVVPGPIVLNLSNIFTPSVKIRPSKYRAIVRITDKARGESMMCIGFYVTLAGHASMINQVTE